MPLRSFLVAAASLALAACAHSASPLASPLVDAPLFQRDLAASDVIVIGEIHGTREAPRAFADLVRALDGHTLVALELTAEMAALDCAAETAPASWTDRMQDGRTSQAMRDMLCALRAQEAAGQIAILPIDGRSTDTPTFYESAANRIGGNIAKGEFDNIVAYTGNFHSANRAPSLTSALRSRGFRVVSATTSSAQGSYWACSRTDGQLECGPQMARGGICEGPDSSSPDWVPFNREPQNWDRCLILPVMTASPPLRP